MKHIFTVDVEDWYHGFDPLYSVPPPHTSRLEIGMRYLLDMLEKFNTKATFFWLASEAEKYSALLRGTVAAGHEIGCHGLVHTPLYSLPPAKFLRDTSKALSIIENISGKQVRCYRAPYFSIRSDTWWALEILASLGIEFDSSILPMKHWRTGMPLEQDTIHSIQTPSGFITEVPITTRKIFHQRIPVSGGGYFRAYPYELTRRNIAHRALSDKPAVFYIHPWEFDPEHPKMSKGGFMKFTHYLQLESTRKKLYKLLEDHSFVPLMETAKQTLFLSHEIKPAIIFPLEESMIYEFV